MTCLSIDGSFLTCFISETINVICQYKYIKDFSAALACCILNSMQITDPWNYNCFSQIFWKKKINEWAFSVTAYH